MQRHRKMRIIASKTLPHRENGSPAGTSTGRPRTTPRRGLRPLTNGCGPRLTTSCLASARASAPAACYPLAGGRGTATGQRPRRLGLSPVTRLWCRGRLGARDGPTLRRHGRGISTGAVGPPWPLFWCPRPRGVGVALRWTLEDPVEARHHPLGVIAIVVAVAAIIFVGGFFFRLPPLPGLCSTRL